MIIILAVLLAIGVAIFPYVIWMAYLRGSSGRDRSRTPALSDASPQSRPGTTLNRGDSY